MNDSDNLGSAITSWLGTLLRTLLLGGLISLVLMGTGVVGIFYLRPVENDPLTAPVRVASFHDDVLELEDGRRIIVEPYGQPFGQALQDSGDFVELEVPDSSFVIIYGKSRRFICGLGMPAITIPLIPQDIPKYDRKMIGAGRLEKKPRDFAEAAD